MPLGDPYDPTELVPVTRQHLQEVLAALNWSHRIFSAEDIAAAARAGRGNIQNSKVTMMIEQAYNHIEGYLVSLDPPSDDELG